MPVDDPTTWRSRGSDLQLLGRRIFCADLPAREPDPAAPPLLAVHGFPTCSWDFAKVAPELTRRRRLLAPDMLGFGFSEKPRGRYSVAEQADLIAALLAQKGLLDRPVDLLCHDLGNTVGCELLARHRSLGGVGPPRWRRVVFLNGGLVPELHRPRPIQRLLRSPLRRLMPLLIHRRSFGRAFAEVFAARSQPGADELDQHWALLTRDGGLQNYPELIGYLAEREQHRSRWVPAVVDCPLPVCLVWGLADPVAVPAIADYVEQHRPSTRVVRLTGVGHYPQLEAPEAVARAILEHLDAA